MTKEKQDIENEEVDSTEAEQEVDINEAIREAFDSAIGDESEEDSIKMVMIGAGATFKNVTRLYNQFMIDAGLAISKEDRNKAVEDALEDKVLDSEDTFNAAVEELMESVKGSTERSAAALIRAYAKKNDVDCYAKPKSEGKGRAGFTSALYDFLIANPECDEAEVKALVNGEGDHPETSENTKRHMSAYLGVHKMVKQIVANTKA